MEGERVRYCVKQIPAAWVELRAEWAIATKLGSARGEDGAHSEQEFSYKSQILGSWGS